MGLAILWDVIRLIELKQLLVYVLPFPSRCAPHHANYICKYIFPVVAQIIQMVPNQIRNISAFAPLNILSK